MFTLFESIVLGIVQGLTEFLPISSSAHQRIVGEFFGNAQDPGARFTAITQIGTDQSRDEAGHQPCAGCAGRRGFLWVSLAAAWC